jgi:amidase
MPGMRIDEYSHYDATGLAALIRAREITPQEAIDCACAAADALDPKFNAIVELFEDRRRAGDPEANLSGPFGGVPFFLKDLGAGEEGRKSEMGSRIFRGFVNDKTSFLTHRFKRAGLVNLGRTTTPEVGFAGTTESVATGKTRNPWNTERSSGGSSGGAASLVAAGVVPLAHGSDGAGSIRIPASLCGLIGLKPSRGRTSFGPDFDEPGLGCMVEFALTRTVRDTATLLDQVAGPYAGDPFLLPRPATSWLESLRAPQRKLRVAFSAVNWFSGESVCAELAAAVQQTARDLAAMGHDVEEATPVFDTATAYAVNRLAFYSMMLLLGPYAAALGVPVDEEHAEPVVLDAYRKMQAMTLGEFALQTLGLNLVRRQIGAFFETYDLLVTPTMAVEHVDFGTLDLSSFRSCDEFRDATDRALTPFTCPINVSGQPAISLPLAWKDERTPIGVHLIGRMAEEDVLLRLAAAFEQQRPWRERTPRVHASRV